MSEDQPLLFGPFRFEPTTARRWRGTCEIALRARAKAVCTRAQPPGAGHCAGGVGAARVGWDACEQDGPAGVHLGDSPGPGGGGCRPPVH